MTTNESPDYNRDQWGRPLIVPPDGGRPLAYTRSSTAAKTVEDTYNLERWARRNIAYGIVRADGLAAKLLPLGPPDTWSQADKDTVNEVCRDAEDVAQASKGADIGTAVHRLTELYDRGEPVHAGRYAPDVDAYAATLARAGLEVVEVECRLVCDGLKMAGTADRIVRDRDGRHLILDLKTGSSVDYGALGWGAQLAAYAHSKLYDVAAGVRLATPDMDTTTGIICHLPAGTGVCRLYEVDLVAGYRAAELANEIRAVRNAARRWMTPRDDGPATTLPAVVPAPEPPAPVPTRAELYEELGRGHDEGATVAPERVAKLKARHDELAPELTMWVGAVEGDARRHNVGFRLKDHPTERRLRLYGALVELAHAGNTDPELVRALVARATGSTAPLSPSIVLGHAVGAMDAGQARRFIHEVVELGAGRLVASFADGPELRLVAPTPTTV